jgi:uncharacterized membrane protein
MNMYLGIKLVHIFGATLLFGTGLGTAFFMLRAYLGGDREVMLRTSESVVVADWLFTTPAVVLQAVTGLWMAEALHIAWNSMWLILVLLLFLLVGICWLPVVWIQIRVRDMLRGGASVDDCRPFMRIWIALGIPAFTCVVVIVVLMVNKPWLDRLL